jgi:hypothetical protein
MDVPPATPPTTPDEEPTVATVVVVLLHVPPAVALLSVIVDPWQTTGVPNIAVADVTFTVVVAVVVQPPYVTDAV